MEKKKEEMTPAMKLAVKIITGSLLIAGIFLALAGVVAAGGLLVKTIYKLGAL
ncbi:MAG: hypothetical protein PVG39_01270 [Desulfobacteraceae bacterium]